MTDHNMRDEDPDIPVHLDVKCVHPASGIIASLVGHFNDENLEEEVVALSTSERVYISKLKDGVLDWEVYDEAPENTQILDFHLLKNPQNGRDAILLILENGELRLAKQDSPAMSCWDHVGSKPNKKTPWIRAISKEYRHDLRTRRGRIPVASATYQMTDSEEKTFFVCSPYERNAFIGQINWDNSHDPFIENFREWTGLVDNKILDIDQMDKSWIADLKIASLSQHEFQLAVMFHISPPSWDASHSVPRVSIKIFSAQIPANAVELQTLIELSSINDANPKFLHITGSRLLQNLFEGQLVSLNSSPQHPGGFLLVGLTKALLLSNDKDILSSCDAPSQPFSSVCIPESSETIIGCEMGQLLVCRISGDKITYKAMESIESVQLPNSSTGISILKTGHNQFLLFLLSNHEDSKIVRIMRDNQKGWKIAPCNLCENDVCDSPLVCIGSVHRALYLNPGGAKPHLILACGEGTNGRLTVGMLGQKLCTDVCLTEIPVQTSLLPILSSQASNQHNLLALSLAEEKLTTLLDISGTTFKETKIPGFDLSSQTIAIVVTYQYLIQITPKEIHWINPDPAAEKPPETGTWQSPKIISLVASHNSFVALASSNFVIAFDASKPGVSNQTSWTQLPQQASAIQILSFAGGLHLLIGLWSSNELCLMNMGEKNGSERIERVSSFSGQPRSIISAYLEQEVILVGTLDGIVHAFEIKELDVGISLEKSWSLNLGPSPVILEWVPANFSQDEGYVFALAEEGFIINSEPVGSDTKRGIQAKRIFGSGQITSSIAIKSPLISNGRMWVDERGQLCLGHIEPTSKFHSYSKRIGSTPRILEYDGQSGCLLVISQDFSEESQNFLHLFRIDPSLEELMRVNLGSETPLALGLAENVPVRFPLKDIGQKRLYFMSTYSVEKESILNGESHIYALEIQRSESQAQDGSYVLAFHAAAKLNDPIFSLAAMNLSSLEYEKILKILQNRPFSEAENLETQASMILEEFKAFAFDELISVLVLGGDNGKLIVQPIALICTEFEKPQNGHKYPRYSESPKKEKTQWPFQALIPDVSQWSLASIHGNENGGVITKMSVQKSEVTVMRHKSGLDVWSISQIPQFPKKPCPLFKDFRSEGSELTAFITNGPDIVIGCYINGRIEVLHKDLAIAETHRQQHTNIVNLLLLHNVREMSQGPDLLGRTWLPCAILKPLNSTEIRQPVRDILEGSLILHPQYHDDLATGNKSTPYILVHTEGKISTFQYTRQ